MELRRWALLAVGLLLCLGGSAEARRGVGLQIGTPGPPLYWSPPVQSDGTGTCSGIGPITITVDSSNRIYPRPNVDVSPCDGHTYATGEYYETTLDLTFGCSNATRTVGLSIHGGRNVRFIGCFIQPVDPAASGVSVLGQSASAYVEGIEINYTHTSGVSDAFDLSGGNPTDWKGGNTTVSPYASGVSTFTVAGGALSTLTTANILASGSSSCITALARVVSVDVINSTVTLDRKSSCATSGNGTLKWNIAYYPKVIWQNILAIGVHGVSSGSHADCSQIQGPVLNVYIDRMTCYTSYQALFYAPQAPVTGFYDLREINFHYFQNPLGPNTSPAPPNVWFHDVAGTFFPYEAFPAIALNEVYIDPGAGKTLGQMVQPTINAFHPVGSPDISAFLVTPTTISWLPTMNVTGVITQGVPLRGDWVVVPSAGWMPYVSPGYQGNIP